MKKLLAILLSMAVILSLSISAFAETPVSVMEEFGEEGIYGTWRGGIHNNTDFSLENMVIVVTPNYVLYSNDETAFFMPYEAAEDGSYNVDTSGTDFEGMTVTMKLLPFADAEEAAKSESIHTMNSYIDTYTGENAKGLVVSVSGVDYSDPMASKTISTITAFAKSSTYFGTVEGLLAGNSFALDNGAVMTVGTNGNVSMNEGAQTGTIKVENIRSETPGCSAKLIFNWGGADITYTLTDVLSDGSLIVTRNDGVIVTMTYVEE